jgi:polyisoprenoid-binding protein YceI
MSITQTQLPAGTWTFDPVHSKAAFAVKHSGIATFRGTFTDLDAKLEDGVLSGRVRVDSVDTPVDQLKGHLLSPDFFDAENHPEVSFRATDVAVDGERATITGDLTIKGTTKTLEATGEVAGPAVYLDGNERIAIALETVINRHDFGVSWNADLPSGGKALGDDVTITVDLQFTK